MELLLDEPVASTCSCLLNDVLLARVNDNGVHTAVHNLELGREFNGRFVTSEDLHAGVMDDPATAVRWLYSGHGIS
jgi:hypothetical protein